MWKLRVRKPRILIVGAVLAIVAYVGFTEYRMRQQDLVLQALVGQSSWDIYLAQDDIKTVNEVNDNQWDAIEEIWLIALNNRDKIEALQTTQK